MFVYQGQELGLEEVDLPDELRQDPLFLQTGGARKGRDGCRVPIPWTSVAPGFGFTDSQPWLPMPEEFGSRSVDAQSRDAASTLELYGSSLAHRPTGAFEWVGCPNGTLVFRRGDVMCLVNVDAPALELPSGDVLVATERVADRLPPASAAWVRVS